MGTFDTAAADMLELDYETRELVWELSQPRIDSTRVRFLIETGASVPQALQAAHLQPADVMKNPQLRPLQGHLAPTQSL